MTEDQFITITQWQKKTFGNATAMSKLYHLEQEVSELKSSVLKFNTSGSIATQSEMELEFADCFLLLFGAANCAGLSYWDICCCIEEKMKINEKRKWGVPDENGVVNHIKE